MSDELKSENENLKQQLNQSNSGVQGLLAQLDAHKQMLNDSLNAGLQLRTNLILIQNNNKELSDKLEAANKKIHYLENPV